MKKIFILGVLVLFLMSFVVAQNNTNQTCAKEGEFANPDNLKGKTNYPDECCSGLKGLIAYKVNDEGECEEIEGTPYLTCMPCGNGVCESINNFEENKCNCPEDCEDEEESNKVCCHKFGYGNQMKKVNSKYQWIDEESCVTPEDFVGGGREVVDDKYCMDKKIIQAKNKINAHFNTQWPLIQAGECPDNCTCTGSGMKCWINGGREMTIRAGKSGNTIVQVKGINMSTKVVLYKSEGEVYGVFKNNQTRIIKIFPDEIKEKIKQKIQAKIQDEKIELDEDGIYQVQAKKKAKLFFVIPTKEKIRMQINSETGEIIRTRTSWWGFLARDVRE